MDSKALNAVYTFQIGASETTRELADDALEELLEHPHVSEFIVNRLFSKCLPEDALWRGEGTFGGSQSNVKLEFLKGPEDALWRGEGTFGGSQSNVKLEFLKALRGGCPRGHRESAVGVGCSAVSGVNYFFAL